MKWSVYRNVVGLLVLVESMEYHKNLNRRFERKLKKINNLLWITLLKKEDKEYHKNLNEYFINFYERSKVGESMIN